MSRSSHKRKLWLIRQSRRLVGHSKRRKLKQVAFRNNRPKTKHTTLKIIPEKWKTEIYAPQIMCLKENFEQTLKFFKKLDEAFFVKRYKKIIINIVKVELISPEVVLILIAECLRLTRFAPETKLSKRGNGANAAVSDLLKGVAFSDYFQSKTDEEILRKSNTIDGRTYIAHDSGIATETQVAYTFVEQFSESLGVSNRRKSQLVEAMGECMQNVSHHAYPDKKNKRWLSQRWWVLGYTNSDTKEAYFAFLDQGVGMPETLKERAKPHEDLFGLSPQELVLKAFKSSFSRHKLENRGHGLPMLKKFVEESKSGELLVQTKKIQVRFRPNERPKAMKTNVPLEGTLLVWQVKAHNIK